MLLAALAACSDDPEGALPASAAYYARCAAPRSGTDPATGMAYADHQGTIDDEKRWLRSWINELYLWYREVPDAAPSDYPTPIAYFGVLKTNAVTATGKPKDRFHFTYSTADWEALSQSGVEAGYGLQWILLSRAPPRLAVVAYNEPGSPGALAGIERGARVVSVDGVDVVNGTDVTTINAGLFPTAENQTHTLGILDVGATAPREVTLTSANVQGTPVQHVTALPTPTGAVGYMLFNDHIATAESELVAAIEQLESAGVTDLVLDMRYNGGGYLTIASQLAYMIAGPTATKGKTFEKLAFNDRYPTTSPYSGKLNTPEPFVSTTVGFSADAGQPLPYLGLSRVFVLTGSGTCSASESVINSLRGVDVQVIGIGATTCGKPYGFVPQDNCGTTFFAIQFQGVNDKGFGDYPDGFAPGGSGDAGLPGCVVGDDFEHPLGDPDEARLAAALGYRANQTCPQSAAARARVAPLVEGEVVKSPWRQNRILRR